MFLIFFFFTRCCCFSCHINPCITSYARIMVVIISASYNIRYSAYNYISHCPPSVPLRRYKWRAVFSDGRIAEEDLSPPIFHDRISRRSWLLVLENVVSYCIRRNTYYIHACMRVCVCVYIIYIYNCVEG